MPARWTPKLSAADALFYAECAMWPGRFDRFTGEEIERDGVFYLRFPPDRCNYGCALKSGRLLSRVHSAQKDRAARIGRTLNLVWC